MDDGTTARFDRLMHALAVGEVRVASGLVGEFLDLPDDEGLRRAVVTAGRISPKRAEALHLTIQDEAQNLRRLDYEATLFCVPVILDTDRTPPMPTRDLFGALLRLAGPSEAMCLVDGWVHLADLLALPPYRYRKLTRDMAETALCGIGTFRVPSEGFPGSPVPPGDNVGGAEMHSFDADTRETKRTTISARMLVGVAVHRSEGTGKTSALRNLATGDIVHRDLLELSGEFERWIEGFLMLSDVGQPIHSSVGTAAAIGLNVLGARLDAVAAISRGRRPITHYCIHGDEIVFAMTSEGAHVLDTATICGVGSNHEHLVELVFRKSAAVVPHASLDDMPSVPAATLN